MAILDQGPPPPPGVANPQPQPSMGQLAGGQSQQDPNLQQSILQKMMVVEKVLDDVASMMPALQPVIADLKMQFRSRVGAVVLQQSQGEQGQGGGMTSLLAGPSPAPATV